MDDTEMCVPVVACGETDTSSAHATCFIHHSGEMYQLAPLRPSTFSVKMCQSPNGSVNVSVGFFVFRKMERMPGFVLSGNNPLRSLFDHFVWTFELSDAPLCGSLALGSILEEMVGSLLVISYFCILWF